MIDCGFGEGWFTRSPPRNEAKGVAFDGDLANGDYVCAADVPREPPRA